MRKVEAIGWAGALRSPHLVWRLETEIGRSLAGCGWRGQRKLESFERESGAGIEDATILRFTQRVRKEFWARASLRADVRPCWFKIVLVDAVEALEKHHC